MKRLRLHVLLLLVPLVLLWVPFYNRAEPDLAGIPFFYWYQMAWVPVTVLVTFFVYRLDRKAGR
ncbi:MAG TPA: DUF3311 domain-containing protein [Rhizomicrobium sp.]|nr:DUF3311 domain-containing protein [Rhizomicrobium sp.]